MEHAGAGGEETAQVDMVMMAWGDDALSRKKRGGGTCVTLGAGTGSLGARALGRSGRKQADLSGLCKSGRRIKGITIRELYCSRDSKIHWWPVCYIVSSRTMNL
jgi:hypothetical protein